ncbi:hypothetical protein CPB86DRAFT_694458, partial [Serendipita vermifera]
RFAVPGFQKCLLSDDGWVTSSGRLLYWVPPNNRKLLQQQYILKITTTGFDRPIQVAFTHFRCGNEWTQVKCQEL